MSNPIQLQHIRVIPQQWFCTQAGLNRIREIDFHTILHPWLAFQKDGILNVFVLLIDLSSVVSREVSRNLHIHCLTEYSAKVYMTLMLHLHHKSFYFRIHKPIETVKVLLLVLYWLQVVKFWCHSYIMGKFSGHFLYIFIIQVKFYTVGLLCPLFYICTTHFCTYCQILLP